MELVDVLLGLPYNSILLFVLYKFSQILVSLSNYFIKATSGELFVIVNLIISVKVFNLLEKVAYDWVAVLNKDIKELLVVFEVVVFTQFDLNLFNDFLLWLLGFGLLIIRDNICRFLLLRFVISVFFEERVCILVRFILDGHRLLRSSKYFTYVVFAKYFRVSD